MRAKKKERKEWRELFGKQCKRSLQHRLIRPDIRDRQNSMFKVATNIGTGTVDYWLWIMDYGSETTGYVWTINSSMIFFFGIIAKLTMAVF